jgi:hypothetical protein
MSGSVTPTHAARTSAPPSPSASALVRTPTSARGVNDSIDMGPPEEHQEPTGCAAILEGLKKCWDAFVQFLKHLFCCLLCYPVDPNNTNNSK